MSQIIKGFQTLEGEGYYDFESLANTPEVLKNIPIAEIGDSLFVESIDENGKISSISTKKIESGIAATLEITRATALEYGAKPTVTEEAGSTSQARIYKLGIPTGKPGETGATGKTAYQYAKDGGYTGTEIEFQQKLAKDIPTVTQDSGESETLVMSQKAVTNLVKNALGDAGTEIETVDSVDDMTDTTKSYVLSTTGTIWMYGEVNIEPAELYDPAAATLDKRHSGSPGTVIAGSGYVMTGYIPVDMTAADPLKLKITTDGVSASDGAALNFQKIAYYNAAKTCVGSKYIQTTSTNGVKLEVSGNDTTIYVGYSLQTDAKEDFYDQIAYVRIEVKSANSPATEADRNLITSIKSTTGSTGYGWYDTGIKPESTSGGNYVTLSVEVAQNRADISEVSRRVATVEAAAGTSTVPSFWQDAVEVCIDKIKALQSGRSCVTFPFFSDNHQRNGHAGSLIAHIMKQCHIPYCFYGGDSIDSGYIADEETMIAQDAAFDAIMSVIPNGRFCRAVGNHDGYWAVSADEKYTYTREQVYELFLREESVAQNKQFGGDGTYYYVEDLASRIRFVILNTNGGSVDDAQLAWLQDVALQVENGWAVVIISHQPISNHYHANISNAADVRAIVTESGAEIIGWFSGHIHRDRIYTGAAVNTIDDTEGEAMGFTQVTITSDHTGIAYDDTTKHTVSNDDQSHAIDFVTINRDTKKVNCTRLGIGNDREFSYA